MKPTFCPSLIRRVYHGILPNVNGFSNKCASRKINRAQKTDTLEKSPSYRGRGVLLNWRRNVVLGI